ncbi:hypothetical protein Trydic_g19653 [Trypoxylus dichotomus]
MSEEQEFSVSEDAKALVKEIIHKNNWEPVSEVKYYPGTEAGDGYACKHVAVEITQSTGTIRLFMKYALHFKISNEMPVDKVCANEIYFYEVVLPAYQEFLRKKNVQDGFRHVPKCYGSFAKNVIALENIKDRGFTLFDRNTIMDDNHIILVLETFAKLHATSFAFKDQDRENYDKLVASWDGDVYSVLPKDSSIRKTWTGMIRDGLKKLDPAKDRKILDRCDAYKVH